MLAKVGKFKVKAQIWSSRRGTAIVTNRGPRILPHLFPRSCLILCWSFTSCGGGAWKNGASSLSHTLALKIWRSYTAKRVHTSEILCDSPSSLITGRTSCTGLLRSLSPSNRYLTYMSIEYLTTDELFLFLVTQAWNRSRSSLQWGKGGLLQTSSTGIQSKAYPLLSSIQYIMPLYLTLESPPSVLDVYWYPFNTTADRWRPGSR